MAKRSDDVDAAAFTRIYMQRLGERIRALRERQGITLKGLAQLSGLSDRFIIAMEKAEANPSLLSLISLARALGTSSLTDLLPKEASDDKGESSGQKRKILALLENRPPEQIAHVIAAVSGYLARARGAHIALVGMRGSGKTTVGQLLAQRMKVPFYELDALIEKTTGLSLAEIFDLEGEQYYRTVEEKTLQRALLRPPGVIAAGGGLVMNPSALLMLKLHSFTVWLQASPEVLLARVRSGKDKVRLAAHPQATHQLRAILDRRTPFYSQANVVIDTTHKSPETVVKAIVQACDKPNSDWHKTNSVAFL